MATYYWVGGSGTWDSSSTTNWSLTSGGSGGAGVPTSVDNVRFDSASGSSANTVTIVTGAVCNDFLYSAAALIGFNGAGNTLSVYRVFRILVNPPTGTFNVDTLFMYISTATGSSFISTAPVKNLTLQNTFGAQATLSVSSDITCDTFYNIGASVVPSAAYAINCKKCLNEGSGAYAKVLGSASFNLTINITPTAGTSFSCTWTGASDAMTNVFVNISGGVASDIDTSAQASNATSFSLTVDNTTINTAQILSGVNNLTLQNSATLKASSTIKLFGNASVGSTSTLDQTSALYPGTFSVEVRKKTGSPNVSRTVTSSGSWFGLGVDNLLSAGTDTLTVNGSYGSLAKPIYRVLSGAASFGSGTFYTDDVTVANGASFSSTVFNTITNFRINSGAVTTGTYTVNTADASINPNGGTIPNLNIVGAGSLALLTSNMVVTNLSITAVSAKGGLQVQNGSSITVSGNLTIAGSSSVNNVELVGYTFPGPTLPWSIIKTSGTVNALFTTISYSNASGGASFQALEINGCVNNGNNTGWIFKQSSGNFFLLM